MLNVLGGRARAAHTNHSGVQRTSRTLWWNASRTLSARQCSYRVWCAHRVDIDMRLHWCCTASATSYWLLYLEWRVRCFLMRLHRVTAVDRYTIFGFRFSFVRMFDSTGIVLFSIRLSKIINMHSADRSADVGRTSNSLLRCISKKWNCEDERLAAKHM